MIWNFRRDQWPRLVRQQLALISGGVSVLLIVGVIIAYRATATPVLDAEALNEARSGVIITRDGPYGCRQRAFDNATGKFGRPSTNGCGSDFDGHLSVIRDGFRGR